MNNSQLRQGNVEPQQKQKINIDNGLDELKNLLPQIREFSTELEDKEERDELLAELSVIEAQVNSPRPKVRIISQALASIRNIAEGAVGSMLASGIIAHADSVLKALGLQ